MVHSRSVVFFTVCVFIVLQASMAFDIEIELDDSAKTDVLPSILLEVADDAYNQNIKGLDALKIQQFDTALEFFTQAIALLPGYWDAENNRGVVYFRKGNIPLARQIWKGILEKDSKYAIAWYNLGVSAFHEKKYEAARKHFKTSLKKRRNFSSALLMLGQIDLRENQPASALNYLAKAHKAEPESQDVWSTYAFALIQSGDTARAENILSKQEQNPVAYQMLGQIAMVRKNYEKARVLLEKSVSLGGDISLLFHVATAEFELGSCAKALHVLNTYIKKSLIADVDTWILAGVASKKCGNAASAKDYFSKGMKHFPHDPLLRYNLGQVFFYEKNYTKAEQLWAPLSDTLLDPTLLHLRALAARYRGDFPFAQTLIQNALRKEKRSEYFDLLGVVLYESGKKKEAIIQFEKAIDLDPTNQSAQLNLAVIKQIPGELQKSIGFAKKALDTCGEECGDRALELSLLLYYNQKVSEAITVLKHVPKAQGSEKNCRYLGLYLSSQQRWDEAIEVLQKAKNEYVLEQQTEVQLIDYLLKAGYYDRAVTAIKELLPTWDRNLWRLYYQLGYAYFEQNQMKLAIQNFEKSIQCKRQNPGSRGMLAYIFNRMGDREKARKLWEKNLKDDPDNSVLWINLGLLHEQEGNYLDALSKYEKASSLDRKNKALYLNIGNAYTALNRHREARMSYSFVLDSPKRELAAYNTFLSARKEGNRSIAKKMIHILENEYASSVYFIRSKSEMLLWDADTLKAVSLLEQISEKSIEDNYVLAQVHLALKNSLKAESYCQKIPSNKTWSSERLKLLASLQFIKGNFQDAYERFNALSDTGFVFHYNKALAAYRAGHYFEAIQIINPFIGTIVGKDKADVCRLMGNAAFSLKQWKNAQSWYQQLSVIELQNAVVQYNLAVASYNLHKMENAWKHYQNARSLDSTIMNRDIEKKYNAFVMNTQKTPSVQDSVARWLQNALDHQDKGKDSLAERVYYQILDREKNHIHALNNLGTIYASRGDFKKSEIFYKRAIKSKNNMAQAYVNLINIYIATQDLNKAKSLFLKAKLYNPYDILLLETEKKLQKALLVAKESP